MIRQQTGNACFYHICQLGKHSSQAVDLHPKTAFDAISGFSHNNLKIYCASPGQLSFILHFVLYLLSIFGTCYMDRSRNQSWGSIVSSCNGVGILLSADLKDNVVEVNRCGDRMMYIRLVVGMVVGTLVCVYAPQAGLGDTKSIAFWGGLDDLVRCISSD
ncbi:hypothetical protein POM88_023292 [Heracleum sosnowskyi]|uniref:Transmembrane protein n=1 Tax=Heracleum sosnowskyi TaxID=360622 RepID=A0AAD8IJJ7_9APIA|nr:hypothetical protein POM88_023292 [Heracleum sosnowskyi]